jgi:hypothetical protein
MAMIGTTAAFVLRAAAVGAAAVVLSVSVATQSKPRPRVSAAPLPGAEAVLTGMAARSSSR